MGAMNPMAAAIGGMLSGGGGAPPGPPGMGAPPRPPIGSATGAPPPTGIGAMPGLQGQDPHTAASSAIMSLKSLKALYPGNAAQIDAMMAQIQAMATTPGGGAPGGPLGAAPSGAPPPMPPAPIPHP